MSAVLVPLHTGGHGHVGAEVAWLPLVAAVAVGVAYAVLAARRGREPRGWKSWCTASFLVGCGLLAASPVPG